MQNQRLRETPTPPEILVDAITAEESAHLRDFILSKLPLPGTLELPYRPDEWDTNGVIQKIQDLAKDRIKQTHVVYNQLEPRSFVISNLVDSSFLGEEYSSYNSNGEILYKTIITVSSSDICSGGDIIFSNGEDATTNLLGTTAIIFRCEERNSYTVSPVSSGNRVSLAICLQEIDRQISYDYPIDPLPIDLLVF
jgi:hypothetical protein